MQTKERRKFMRFDADLEADYWAKGPSLTSGRAKIRDFSREGVGAWFSQPVQQGEHVDLTLKVPGDNVPIFATAEVTWADPAEQQGTGAGLKVVAVKPLDLARQI